MKNNAGLRLCSPGQLQRFLFFPSTALENSAGYSPCGSGIRKQFELMKRNKFSISVFLLSAVMAVVLSGCNQGEFTGNRVKNPDAYLLDIRYMNGNDAHEINLQAGDVLHIRFETNKGELQMEIKAPDGTSVYSGNGKVATDFNLNITQSGVYTIAVEARNANGTIHVQLQDEME